MSHKEIREKFLKFFEQRGHKIVPSSSLLPTDPSVLFTTAGMQQFKPYYTDPTSAPAKNVVSIQKCLRTSDIDEVGDETHLTFFEMLGNFSFGGYWKKEVIEYAYEFITRELGLTIDYVTVFGGADTNQIFQFKKIKADILPVDEDSKNAWNKLGIKIELKKGVEGLKDNFWGPTGNEGPCGPTTEIYVNGVEIWNIVFNELYCTADLRFKLLETKGVDTGMGLERLAMVVQKKKNIFETDLFEPLISALPTADTDKKRKRVISDHARAFFFLISDGITPSNKEQGYILRRLMRRMIVQAHLGSSGSFSGMDTLSIGTTGDIKKVFEKIYHNYKGFYPKLNLELVNEVFDKEFNQFNKTFRQGIKEIKFTDHITAPMAFNLYGTFGITFEIIKDIGGDKVKNLLREDFEEQFKKHQEKSRAGAKKKFGGHGLLLNTGELKAGNEEELKKATRLHSATHLLHASLRKVLGEEVKQAGSDITAERLRFDFTFPRKLTPEEIQKIEDTVNDAIQKDYQVTKEEMPYEDAIKSGALAFFKLKYPDRVNVYTIGPDTNNPPSTGSGQFFSKELCGGPHVSHTAEVGKIKIIKEEAVSVGVRRIRAVVEEV